MRCVLYLRQSLAGDELAIDRQEAECRRVAESRGFEVIDKLVDNNKSASTGKRPAYEELLRRIQSHQVDAVVVYRLDRLLRRLTDLESLIELLERSGTVLVTVQGDLQLDNAQGRLIGRILASVARAEVEVKSERHKLANGQRAALGQPHGSRRPYGYQSDLLTICEPEAEVLREMARQVISGRSYKHVAWWANRQGHLTTMHRPWLPITVRNMLRKDRYAGIREYNGAQYPGQWPAVFDAETWAQLQFAMKARSERQPIRPKPRKYLLTGLAICGTCGLHLNGCQVRDRPGSPIRRIYGCRGMRDTGLVRGCGKVRRNADALDYFVTQAVLYRLESPELGSLLNNSGTQSELPPLLLERQHQQLRLDRLVDDYATGLLDRSQFARAKATAQQSLKAIEADIDRMQREALSLDIPVGKTLRTAWDEADDDWRRQLLGLVIKKVTVNPGLTKPFYMVNGVKMRFDASLIDIEWIA